MIDVPAIVESFRSITLAETLEQAALQRRVDTKYLTDETAVATLLADLRDSFRVLEIDGRRVFNYHSEYLDSPGREAYRAHIQGRRRRYKCRVRQYVDSGESLVEVKLKGARGETVKYRTPYSDDQSVSDCADFLAECVWSSYGLPVDQRLRPVLGVDYRRITLVSLTSPERVTLDNGLSFLDVATQRRRTLKDEQWIVETKSATGRGFADARLRDAHVHPVSVSKYVLGVALTDPDVRVHQYAGLIRDLDAGPLQTADVPLFSAA